MTHILSEDASLPLVDVVLHNLVKEEKVIKYIDVFFSLFGVIRNIRHGEHYL